MTVEQVVDGGCHIGWSDRPVVGRKPAPIDHRRRLGAAAAADARAGAGDQRVDQVIERDIGIGMMADLHGTIECTDGSPRIELPLR